MEKKVVVKKQWQKPDFVILDSPEAKTHHTAREATGYQRGPYFYTHYGVHSFVGTKFQAIS